MAHCLCPMYDTEQKRMKKIGRKIHNNKYIKTTTMKKKYILQVMPDNNNNFQSKFCWCMLFSLLCSISQSIPYFLLYSKILLKVWHFFSISFLPKNIDVLCSLCCLSVTVSPGFVWYGFWDIFFFFLIFFGIFFFERIFFSEHFF